MSVQYAGNPFMSRRLIEVIQELRDYLGPEAYGLSNEDVLHKVMCQALGCQRQLKSELKVKEPSRPVSPRNKVNHDRETPGSVKGRALRRGRRRLE